MWISALVRPLFSATMLSAVHKLNRISARLNELHEIIIANE